MLCRVAAAFVTSIAQPLLRAVVENCASFNRCAHSSQHTSTALPPIVIMMGWLSSLQSQAAQVLSAMTFPFRTRNPGTPSKPQRRNGTLSRSLAIFRRALTPEGRLPEFRWGTAVSRAERGAEVAVTGESKVQTESGEVVIVRQKIQRPGQAQPQLVPIQRQPLHLLKDLRQVNGRSPDFRGDFSQRPSPREIAREDKLDSIYKLLPSNAGACRVRSARSQCSLHKGQRQALRFQWFGKVPAKAVAQQGQIGRASCRERV